MGVAVKGGIRAAACAVFLVATITASGQTPVYTSTLTDASTGDNPTQSFTHPKVACSNCYIPDSNGSVDVYTDDIYERPTASGSSANQFLPALDITHIQTGMDATFFYMRITLYGIESAKLPYVYGYEMNFDGDARGDLFVRVDDPTVKVGTTFGVQGVIAAWDRNNNVGGASILTPNGPGGVVDGYETKVFDQGTNNAPGGAGGNDAVRARIVSGTPNAVEFAVERVFLNALNGGVPVTAAAFRGFSIKGSTSSENDQYFHDKFGRKDAGSPHPWLTLPGAPANCPNGVTEENALLATQKLALDSGSRTPTLFVNPCYPSGNLNNMDNTATVSTLAVPTAASMGQVEVTAHGGTIAITWDTSFEVGNLGFHVYREDSAGRVRLTPSILPGSSLMIGPADSLTAGNRYNWVDPDASESAVYWVEELDVDGSSKLHGPFGQERTSLRVPNDPLPRQGWETRHRERAARMGAARITSAPVVPPAASDRVEATAAPGKAKNQEATQFALASSSSAKIFITETGWYRVGQPELAASGFSTAIDPRLLQLFVDGIELPISVEGEADGTFDASDSISFYGTGINTPMTGSRVYWLSTGTTAGKRIAIASPAAFAPATNDSFLDSIEREENYQYAAWINNGEADNFFGSNITTIANTISIPVRHLDLTPPGNATIDLALQGGAANVAFHPDHRVQVSVNGRVVDEMVFDNQELARQTFSFPQSSLIEGANSVTLQALQTGDFSGVDFIRISYWHTYEAENNRLLFTADGGKRVTVDGFGSGAVRILDVTDPVSPSEIVATTQPSTDGFAVTVDVAGKGTRVLLAVSDSAARTPAALRLNDPSEWNKNRQTADWIVIAHGSLLASATPLAQLRESEGLATATIDVEDLYDEFNYGIEDPSAIRRFIEWATTRWRKPPKFVLLLGHATFDPRNYYGSFGFDEPDLVPTKLVATQRGETASDDWFSDFDDDGVADVAIGRLPARTPAEAAIMVGKVVGYATGAAGSWTQNSLIVADRTAHGNDFAAAGDVLAAELPAAGMHKTYVDVLGSGGATNADLVDQINNTGVVYLNFLGHGAIHRWSNENILTTSGALALTNGTRLPFVVGLTCLTGQFHDVFGDSIGEALLKAPAGGAVAVWGSSSVTPLAAQEPASHELARLLFPSSASETMPIGQAVMRAKLATPVLDVRRSWILFGDPATTLRYQP